MANGLPQTRDERPALAPSAIGIPEAPVSLLQPAEGLIPLPDAPISLIGDVPTADPVAPEPMAPEVIAEPIAPTLPVEELTPEFEGLRVSPEAELAVGVAPSFVETQDAVVTLSGEQDRLELRGAEIQRDLGLEKDFDKRSALEQQGRDNIAARQTGTQALQTARAVRDREEVKEAQRLGDAQANLQQRTALDLRQELLEQDEAQIASSAETQRRQDAERERVAGLARRRQALLERGPKAVFEQTALRMVREALKPLAFGQQPNFDKAIDDLTASNRQAWIDDLNAATNAVSLGDGSVEDIARQDKERQIQMSAIRQAHIDRTILTVDKQLAETSEEFRATQGQALLDNLRLKSEEEAAHRDALAMDNARKQAADDAKRRKTEAEIQLIGAKVGTEQAKARGLAVKAARDAGRSRGSGSRKDIKRSGLFGKAIQAAVEAGEIDEKGAAIVFKQGVIDPITGDLTRRADGSFVLATTPALATELNKDGAKLAEINSLVNEAVAIRGAKGWEPTSAWFNSAAGKRMKAITTGILLINKDLKELGILSGDDIPLLKSIQGGDLSGREDPRPTLEDMRRRLIKAFNQKRKSLAPGSQALAFATVTDAPTRSIADLNTLIDQGPNLRTGDVPSSARKLAGVDEKFELLVEEAGGDIEKASRKFTRETRRSVARNKAHQDDLLDEFESAVPGNWDKLKRDAGKAALSVQLLGEDASGAEINRAEATKARTARAMENALSPRAKRLRDGIEENRQFLFDFEKKARGELRKQAEAKQVRGEEAAAREREVRLSKLPVSGKI